MTGLGHGWCPTCRQRRAIVDTHTESTYAAGGEYGYRVTVFDCDHDTDSDPIRLGEAPGTPAPFQRPITATTEAIWGAW